MTDSPSKTRKMNVTLTLEVDIDAWADTYGLFPAIVRGDVQQYVLTAIQGTAACEDGLISSAALK